MKKMKTLKTIAIFISLLIMSLPVCFATELNLFFDGRGNLVTGDGKYREYNSLNQLVRVRNGSTDSDPILQKYTYHPTEERVLKKHDYVKNETTYYWSKNFVTVSNSSGMFNFTYVYHNGQIVAQELSGTKSFIHSDHLGSSQTVTDINGNVVENTSYSPFGEVLTGGDATRYGYEAKEHDSVVGDTDFHFRKYKAEWALFTQPDSLLPNVYDPQMLNRYMFERANPYGNTDETGHILGLMEKNKQVNDETNKVSQMVRGIWEATPGHEYVEKAYNVFVADVVNVLDWAAHEIFYQHAKDKEIKLGMTKEKITEKRKEGAYSGATIALSKMPVSKGMEIAQDVYSGVNDITAYYTGQNLLSFLDEELNDVFSSSSSSGYSSYSRGSTTTTSGIEYYDYGYTDNNQCQSVFNPSPFYSPILSSIFY